MNHHLIAVKGFACPSDPRSCVVGDSLSLVGSPKTICSWVKGQTKCDSKEFDDEKLLDKILVTRAPS